MPPQHKSHAWTANFRPLKSPKKIKWTPKVAAATFGNNYAQLRVIFAHFRVIFAVVRKKKKARCKGFAKGRGDKLLSCYMQNLIKLTIFSCMYCYCSIYFLC